MFSIVVTLLVDTIVTVDTVHMAGIGAVKCGLE